MIERHGPLGADREVGEVNLVHGVVGSVPLLVEIGAAKHRLKKF